LRLYDKLHRYHLSGVVATLFSLIEPLLLHNLNSAHPSLTLLNIYKAGYICRIMGRR
jgi:hypothetical protein